MLIASPIILSPFICACGICLFPVLKHSEATRAVSSLSHIAGWLVEHAEVLDKDGLRVQDVDLNLFPLKSLEHLAGLWAQGDNETVGPTLVELKDELDFHASDVPGALLRVLRTVVCGYVVENGVLEFASLRNLARRHEVAEVRRRLKQQNDAIFVRFNLVDATLDDNDRDIVRATEVLMQDPSVQHEVSKTLLKEELFKAMPMARPSYREIEHALATAEGQYLSPDSSAVFSFSFSFSLTFSRSPPRVAQAPCFACACCFQSVHRACQRYTRATRTLCDCACCRKHTPAVFPSATLSADSAMALGGPESVTVPASEAMIPPDPKDAMIYTKATTSSALVQTAATRVSHDALILSATHLLPDADARPWRQEI